MSILTDGGVICVDSVYAKDRAQEPTDPQEVCGHVGRFPETQKLQPTRRCRGAWVPKADFAKLGAGAGDASRFRIERDFEDHQRADKTT